MEYLEDGTEVVTQNGMKWTISGRTPLMYLLKGAENPKLLSCLQFDRVHKLVEKKSKEGGAK